MASHGFPLGLVLHQDQNLTRAIKDSPPYLSTHVPRQEVVKAASFNLSQNQSGELWKPIVSACESNGFVEIDSIVKIPVLLDAQDAHPDSMLFSYGIIEQCTRTEKVFNYLKSGSSGHERGIIDLSLLSDLAGVQAFECDAQQHPFFSPLVYPNSESQTPYVDLMEAMARNSKIIFHPNGQVIFTGNGDDLKDMVSVVADYYLSKSSTSGRRISSPVPQFRRPYIYEAVSTTFDVSAPTFKSVTVAPLKSPRKIKLKPSTKKKQSKKGAKERDSRNRNYLNSCESLLSLIFDKNQDRKAALKKSGPELPELLTQFSAGIAGTGIAVIFSVIYKVVSGRAPFCPSRLSSTGLGFGLVWVSWAVNKLRGTILNMTKNTTKMRLSEEEVMKKVDRNIKEIYFRAAALMTLTMLRFA